jgi:polyhydroxybutyrate depolymerase
MTRALALALLTALAGPASAKAPLPPGDHTRSFSHQRLARSYVLHLPPAAAKNAPLPLVLAFHGGGGNAEGFQAYAGLDAVADRDGFAVAYPNGTGPASKNPNLPIPPRLLRLFTWNAGRCCAWAMDNKVADVSFAKRVIEDASERASIDRARVYATGHSNGAMMAYRIAAEAADLVAAIAPVAGAMNLRGDFAPSRPVPLLHIHSIHDPRALFAGGSNKSITGQTIHHEPVFAGLRAWEKRNGCSGPGKEIERRTAPARNGDGEHTAIHVAASCPAAAPVELWKLERAGHGWPGDNPGPLGEGLMGPHTNVISAAEEAWRFFARFPTNP